MVEPEILMDGEAAVRTIYSKDGDKMYQMLLCLRAGQWAGANRGARDPDGRRARHQHLRGRHRARGRCLLQGEMLMTKGTTSM